MCPHTLADWQERAVVYAWASSMVTRILVYAMQYAHIVRVCNAVRKYSPCVQCSILLAHASIICAYCIAYTSSLRSHTHVTKKLESRGAVCASVSVYTVSVYYYVACASIRSGGEERLYEGSIKALLRLL